ncbi:adhesive plaque matrix protein [Daphnia magna]|uniref:adhesive plaque matrix protein n=1 Tax=Daphnia magna TaxID=35525 RepID=UPI001E1BA57A|nr:adhesive plaque matrix protein [Daphnia magna]
MKVLMVCLSAVLIAVFAEPEAAAEAHPNTRSQYPAHSAYPRPSYPAPAYPKPSYPAPAHPKPSYPAPAHPKPSYPAPAYPKPSSPAQAYPKPLYPAPVDPKPAYPAPAYPKPSYPAQAYPKPSYPAPAYPKPSYSAPVDPKPAYPAPAYPKPSYPAPVDPKPAYPAGPTYPKPAYAEPAYPVAYEKKYESQYEHYCDPRKAPKCSNNGTETFCLKDSEYPVKEVKYAIDYDPLVLNKYADVADQSADNLVDGLTSLAEEHFDYSNYHGSAFEKGHWVGDEGYICPSDVLYARPVRAVNADGEWRVIVQNIAWPGYTQTQRIETCLFPGASCRTLAACYRSECLQQYIYHRMLSFDPCDPQKGIFIDIYKMPSACSCHLPQFH